MGTLGTGQPFGSIVQTAYVVEDIESEMKAYVDRLGVGPWYLADRFRPPNPLYRGKVVAPLFSLAVAYSGATMIDSPFLASSWIAGGVAPAEGVKFKNVAPRSSAAMA